MNRDTYDSTRMPKYMFDVLLAVAMPGELFIERYAPAHPGPERIAPNWDIYTAYTRAPETWSLEFVMYDAEGRWALLADADATVFGAEPSLANEIDEHLARQGTGLEAMTYDEWGELDPVTQPGAKYNLAVIAPSE